MRSFAYSDLCLFLIQNLVAKGTSCLVFQGGRAARAQSALKTRRIDSCLAGKSHQSPFFEYEAGFHSIRFLAHGHCPSPVENLPKVQGNIDNEASPGGCPGCTGVSAPERGSVVFPNLPVSPLALRLLNCDLQ